MSLRIHIYIILFLLHNLKIERYQGIMVYKKFLKSKHLKDGILRELSMLVLISTKI